MKKLNQDNFLSLAKLKFPNLDYSKVAYINNKEKIIIICSLHGEFKQSPTNHIRSKGCPKCSRQHASFDRIINYEKFKELAQLKHNNKFDYSKVNFKSIKQKIIIICPIHGEFFQSPINHLKHDCFKCSKLKNKLKINEIIERANKIHNKYNYLIEHFNNIKDEMQIICKHHGLFRVKINIHLSGNGKCPKCCKIERNKKLIDEFIEKANKIHNFKYQYILDDNFSKLKKIDIVCSIHGKFKQIKYQHLNGSGCRKCSNESKKIDFNEFLEKVVKIHNKYDYSKVEFNLVSDKVEIICNKHGSFWQRVSAHIYKANGCPNCSKIVSKAEAEWLDFLKIPKEYRNKKIEINNRIFYPDGYDPIKNILYEFYGDYWHGNINVYDPNKFNKINKTKFVDLYEATMEREKYIKSNGYDIISIWENDWNKLKNGYHEKF